jgi:hypothetical protein
VGGSSRNDEHLPLPERAPLAGYFEFEATFQDDERLLERRVSMESYAAARLLEGLEHAVRAFAVGFISLEGELQRAQLVCLAFHRAEVLEVFGVAHEPSLPQVERGLGELQASLSGQQRFAPRRARLPLRIGAADYPQALLSGPLVSLLRAEAPGVALQMTSYPDPREQLESGAIDVAITVKTKLPGVFAEQLLFSDGFVRPDQHRAGTVTAPGERPPPGRAAEGSAAAAAFRAVPGVAHPACSRSGARLDARNGRASRARRPGPPPQYLSTVALIGFGMQSIPPPLRRAR